MRECIMNYLMKFLKKKSLGILTIGFVGFLSFSGELHAKSYRAELRQWTHSKQLFNTTTMQTKIIWRATYYSPGFRRAFVEEHVKRKHMDAVAAARYLAEQEGKQTQGDEFFVGMYTRKPYKSFSLGKESFWEAVLTTGSGEELKPVSIEFVEITPYEEVMFPYVNRWTQGYRVIFPKTDLGKSFKLTLRSVIGQTHLNWD